jgi:hypothetical protein
MNISQAFKYIDNAIEFWVELSEYDEKKSDVKKTDKARNIIRKTIEKNIKTIQLLRQERKK